MVCQRTCPPQSVLTQMDWYLEGMLDKKGFARRVGPLRGWVATHRKKIQICSQCLSRICFQAFPGSGSCWLCKIYSRCAMLLSVAWMWLIFWASLKQGVVEGKDLTWTWHEVLFILLSPIWPFIDFPLSKITQKYVSLNFSESLEQVGKRAGRRGREGVGALPSFAASALPYIASR